jgi:endonuclease G
MAIVPVSGAGGRSPLLKRRHAQWRHLSLLLSFSGLLVAQPAQATSRNCTATEKADGDHWLWLSPADKALSIQTQLPWGAPVENSATADPLLIQRDYVVKYSTSLLVPLWSAEKLKFSSLGKVKGRVECFRGDPRLPAPVASIPSDYKEPIYDQGHSTPDADQDKSVRSVVNTYVMSNMSPQNCQFNRGIWQILEQITRRWSAAQKTVYVLNGAVFDRNNDGIRDSDEVAPRMQSTNGKSRVAIPSAFYKIVAYKRPDGAVAVISILLPHTTANPNGSDALDYLSQHITTVAAIERLTGYDFFPGEPNLDEATTLWPFENYTPQTLCHQ